MQNFKSVATPVKRKVLGDYGYYIAPDKGRAIDIGKSKGEELLVLSSFMEEDKPFLIVYDEELKEAYSLYAGFIEKWRDFFDKEIIK